jgi:5-methylcytosine-specific restriction endonuclease McrA
VSAVRRTPWVRLTWEKADFGGISLAVEPRGLPRKTRDALRLELFERDDFRCRDCGYRWEPPLNWTGSGGYSNALTMGHIVAWSKGGRWTLENLITQCAPCNQRLGNREWIDPERYDIREAEHDKRVHEREVHE